MIREPWCWFQTCRNKCSHLSWIDATSVQAVNCYIQLCLTTTLCKWNIGYLSLKAKIWNVKMLGLNISVKQIWSFFSINVLHILVNVDVSISLCVISVAAYWVYLERHVDKELSRVVFSLCMLREWMCIHSGLRMFSLWWLSSCWMYTCLYFLLYQ